MKNSLSQEQIQKNKDAFISLCRENIHRRGIELLLDKLEKTDFFIAPCSTKYHLNCRGGLCQHSLNVYKTLLDLVSLFNIRVKDNIETLTIIALFHDICKADFYTVEMKPVKHGNIWSNEPVYVINDMLPLGHSEKSLYLLTKCIDLTAEEACAIRWHMGAFDNAAKSGEQAFNTASDRFELVSLLHAADLLSSKILEKNV